jgi:hypothetical protein
MHIHSRAEDLPREVVDAFKAADPANKGTIPARQLRHMLLRWGEQLSAKEGECQGIYNYWLILQWKLVKVVSCFCARNKPLGKHVYVKPMRLFSSICLNIVTHTNINHMFPK